MSGVFEKLTLRDMALVLGVSEFTLSTMARQGEVPCEGTANRTLFLVTQVLTHFLGQEEGAI